MNWLRIGLDALVMLALAGYVGAFTLIMVIAADCRDEPDDWTAEEVD